MLLPQFIRNLHQDLVVEPLHPTATDGDPVFRDGPCGVIENLLGHPLANYVFQGFADGCGVVPCAIPSDYDTTLVNLEGSCDFSRFLYTDPLLALRGGYLPD